MRHHGNKIVHTTDSNSKSLPCECRSKSNDERLTYDNDTLREQLFDAMQRRSVDKLQAAFTHKEAAHG